MRSLCFINVILICALAWHAHTLSFVFTQTLMTSKWPQEIQGKVLWWLTLRPFLKFKTSKNTSFEYFMKYSWSVFSQKSLLILTNQNTSLFFLKPMGIVTRWASYSQRTARCTVDSAKIMQQLNLMLRGKSESRNADQTPLKLRRMCLNDTGNVNHVERSPHFNFFGPRSMIFAADCSSFTQNQLHGSCCWNRTQAACSA